MMNATIIIPVFNTEDHLPECLASLQSQTRQTFEIIIVDDGSAGDVQTIVERFQSGSSLAVKYLRHPNNLGTLCARFTGAEHANGDYIGFLDPDDTAHPDFVERLLGTAEKTQADIVGSARFQHRENYHFTLRGADEIFAAYADKKICNWNIWTKFFRRTLVLSLDELKKISRAERVRHSEDVVFNVFSILKDPTYVHIPNILVEYNEQREGSSTNPRSSDAIRSTFQGSLRSYEIIREMTPNHRHAVASIIHRSAKFRYGKFLVYADEDDVAWACSQVRKSLVGDLVIYALFELASELRFDDAEQKRQIATLSERLSVEREKRKNVQEKLTDLREVFREARERRQRLRPILGDLYRWSKSVLSQGP